MAGQPRPRDDGQPERAAAGPSRAGAAGAPRAGSGASGPPWENRARHGFWVALWRTWRDSVFRPVPFFRTLPPDGGYGPPLLFAVLMTAVGLFFSFYWSALEGLAAGGGQMPGVEGEVGGVFLVIATLVAFVFVIPLYIGVLFVSAAVLHVAFMVVGAGRRGFEGTFRALAYASGPAVFSLFPFFGPILSLVWGIVLWFIGMREVQRTTNGRTALGFLLPAVAAFVLLFLFALLLALLVGSVERGIRV
jgi:hypothetical protein